MRKLLVWIFLLPLAIVVIFFTIANRAPVTVHLDPLPLEVSLPLYAVAMVASVIGLVAGGAAAWVRAGKWRRLAREKRRQAERLEGELGRLRETAAVPAAPAALPASAVDEG